MLMNEKVDASKTCRAEGKLGRMVGGVEDVESTDWNESVVRPRRVERQGEAVSWFRETNRMCEYEAVDRFALIIDLLSLGSLVT